MIASVKKIYVELTELTVLLTLSETTIQRLVRQEKFPKPRMLSGRRVAWLMHEVEDWANKRPVSQLLPPQNTGKRRTATFAPETPDGRPAS